MKLKKVKWTEDLLLYCKSYDLARDRIFNAIPVDADFDFNDVLWSWPAERDRLEAAWEKLRKEGKV